MRHGGSVYLTGHLQSNKCNCFELDTRVKDIDVGRLGSHCRCSWCSLAVQSMETLHVTDAWSWSLLQLQSKQVNG